MAARQGGVAGIPPAQKNQEKSMSKADNFQAEHEKFLEEFGKPTVIYRLIRAHFLANPRFLYRNLNYMQRKKKVRTKRGKFSFDTLLKMAEQREADEHKRGSILGKKPPNHFNLVVLGFCDGETWDTDTEAKIEIQLLQLFGNKRKERKVIIKKAWGSSCKIPIKSQPEESVCRDFTFPIPKGRYPVLPIPKETFTIVNGNPIQSIRLCIRVTIPASKLISKTSEEEKEMMTNGIENCDNHDKTKANGTNGKVSYPNLSLRKANGATEDDKSTRRQRSLPHNDRENAYEDELHRNNKSNEVIVYGGILSIFDSDSKTNIPEEGNADLEVRLNRLDCSRKTFAQKRVRRETSWEVSLQTDHSKVQDYLLRNGTTGCPAKIAFAFRVSTDKMPAFTSMVTPVKPSTPVMKSPLDYDTDEDHCATHHIVYTFVMGNGQKQSTESRNDLACPWCSVKCVQLYSLLKHLEVCHPRFKFSFTRITNGARVQVTLNESFDGSYSGSAYDLVAQPPGQAFGRNVPPGQRQQLFCMLVFNSKKMRQPKFSLSEFFDNEEKHGDHQPRSYMIGHNRVYHHTTTCLPIDPREIDEDSEGEPDPEWLRIKTCMMIDEFTDVNEGEKEIMKMWNHHVMHENYVGDCQIPLACQKFVDKFGHKVIDKNLYRNFILHLTNMYDFGLLPAQAFHNTVQALHAQMKETNSVMTLKDSWNSTSNTYISSSPTGSNSTLSTPSTLSTTSIRGAEPMDVDGDFHVKLENNHTNGKANGTKNGS